MTSINASLAKYLILIGFLTVLLLAGNDQVALAKAPLPPPVITTISQAPLPSISEVIAILRPPKTINAMFVPLAIAAEKDYRAVPPEDLNPIEWVDPYQNKERMTTYWLPIINQVLESGDYPNVDALLIMGMIAQESGGDPNPTCNDFDVKRGTCAVGLMAVSPEQCGVTSSQLLSPTVNITCGIRIINIVYGQALEHGFRPGKDATRAALAAFNCSWSSLLENRCFSFGGWMYSSKILNYWVPLLEKYIEEKIS